MRAAWTWLHSCALVFGAALVGSCGGNAFTSGDAGVGDGGSDTGTEAGVTDGALEGSTGIGTHCGTVPTCFEPTKVCCIAGSTDFTCAHATCGCNTQLACSVPSDCPLLTPVCCIANVQDTTCTSGHDVSSCTTATGCQTNGGTPMCNPSNPEACIAIGKTCKTDSSTLTNFGLPAGFGYGVCD